MCDYEDQDLISCYTRKQAVEDGLLVEILNYNDKHVMATAQIRQDFGLSGLYRILNEFVNWKYEVEPKLPEHKRLFSTFKKLNKKDKKVWVVEDRESYTIMYPDQY